MKREDKKREENIEYRISDIELRSEAAIQVSGIGQGAESRGQIVIGHWSLVIGKQQPVYSLFLVSHFLFLISYLYKEQRAKSKEQRSSIQYPASSIQYPVSSIQYPVSSIQHPVTNLNSTVTHIINFSFNPLFAGQGVPCRRIRFAGYFLSTNFLTMRENFKSSIEKTRNNRSNVVTSGSLPPFRGARGVISMNQKKKGVCL